MRIELRVEGVNEGQLSEGVMCVLDSRGRRQYVLRSLAQLGRWTDERWCW
jgi:hypothetical protein